MLSKGKKYWRLPISSVVVRLDDSLRRYVEYKTTAH